MPAILNFIIIGEVFWVFPLGMVAGALIMIPLLGVARRRAERRAREAERRAREAERMAEIGALTSGLAHEIKNPLSTIGLNAQLLREALADSSLPGDEKDRFLRRLNTLRLEINRLSGILNDFLQFAGRMKLDPRLRDLREIVDELGDFYHPQCEKSGIVLRSQQAAAPVRALIDETLFKQALLNLMINATQAMTNSGPDDQPRELMLRTETDGGDALVHVIDTGPGIDPERMQDIFKPYVSTRVGGTGLGLPTTQRIMVAHGGTVSAHSEPGRGSDFVVRLPQAPPE